MKYDRTKTVIENLLQLINASAKRTVLSSELTFGNPVAITPGAGNGNNNTQITATFVKGSGTTGAVNGSQSTIQYNRLTLANSYPTANRTIDITDADTLTTVKTKIAASQRLTEAEFSLSSSTLPTASTTSSMPVDPVSNSKLYAPGQLVLTLNNTSAITYTFTGQFLMSGGDKAEDSVDIRNLKTTTALTRVGDTKIKKSVKRYNTASIYLDGVGDRATLPISDVGNIQSGDFTIEAWVYPLALSGVRAFIAQCSQESGKVNNGWYLGQNGTNVTFFFGPNTIMGPTVIGGTLVANQWQHVAVSRQGSTFRLFLNGALVTSATSATTGSPTTVPLQIGNYYSGAGTFPADTVTDYQGYLDQVAVYVGSAKYTAAFTPARIYPIGQDNYTYNGQFLLRGDYLPDGSLDVRNLVTGNLLTRAGDARIRTNQFKYGTGSVYLDGTGDRITFPSTELATLLGGDFTIETWVNLAAIPQYSTILAQWSQQAPATTYAGFIFYLNNGVPEFYHRAVSSTVAAMVGSAAIPINTWTHLAVTRQGSVFRMFVNGVQVATVTNATVLAGITVPYSIGNYHNTSGVLGAVTDFNGYLDDFGVLVGTAKYTADFTPAAIA